MSSVESPKEERMDEALGRAKSHTSIITGISCLQSPEDSLTEPRYSPAFPNPSVGTLTRTYSTRQMEASRTELAAPFRVLSGIISTRISSILCFGRRIRMKGSYSLRAHSIRISGELFLGGGSSFITL